MRVARSGMGCWWRAELCYTGSTGGATQPWAARRPASYVALRASFTFPIPKGTLEKLEAGQAHGFHASILVIVHAAALHHPDANNALAAIVAAFKPVAL